MNIVRLRYSRHGLKVFNYWSYRYFLKLLFWYLCRSFRETFSFSMGNFDRKKEKKKLSNKKLDGDFWQIKLSMLSLLLTITFVNKLNWIGLITPLTIQCYLTKKVNFLHWVRKRSNRELYFYYLYLLRHLITFTDH